MVKKLIGKGPNLRGRRRGGHNDLGNVIHSTLGRMTVGIDLFHIAADLVNACQKLCHAKAHLIEDRVHGFYGLSLL